MTKDVPVFSFSRYRTGNNDRLMFKEAELWIADLVVKQVRTPLTFCLIRNG